LGRIIYINGKKAAPPTYELFVAVDLEITDFVHAGENIVVCSVDNSDQPNTGVGGLMHPVVLYVPAEETGTSK
jgi:hypothetical protein